MKLSEQKSIAKTRIDVNRQAKGDGHIYKLAKESYEEIGSQLNNNFVEYTLVKKEKTTGDEIEIGKRSIATNAIFEVVHIL